MCEIDKLKKSLKFCNNPNRHSQSDFNCEMKTNKEIAKILSANRETSRFARFLNLSRQGLYKMLSSDKPYKNLYGKWVEFNDRGKK